MMSSFNKYPIGTRVTFIGHKDMVEHYKKDIGRSGTIVKYGTDWGEGVVYILLDNSKRDKFTFITRLSAIELEKNTQLLFDFMHND